MRFIEAILFSLLTFLTPIKGLIILTMLFVGLDTIVGIYASVKAGYKFRSSRLFNLAVKTFFYVSAIMLSFLVDKFVLGGTTMGIQYLMAKICCVMWIYVEVVSLNEKSQMLGNRSMWVIIKEAIKKVKSLKDDIKNIIQ